MSIVTIILVCLLPPSAGLLNPFEHDNAARFLEALKQSNAKVLTIGRVIQWNVSPKNADYLLDHNWDYMVILEDNSTIPATLAAARIAYTTSVRLQVPGDFVANFKSNQQAWLHPAIEDIPPPNLNIGVLPMLGGPLMSASSQNLELTPGLLALAQSEFCPTGAISFLNFASLQPFPAARASYATYKKAFETGPANDHKSVEKITGTLEQQNHGWDEISFQQFPTVLHFADCIAGISFQELNFTYRVPSLRDFGMLMVSELELDWTMSGSSKRDGPW